MRAAILQLEHSCLSSEVIRISFLHALRIIFLFLFHDWIEAASLNRRNAIDDEFSLDPFLDRCFAGHESYRNFREDTLTFPITVYESCWGEKTMAFLGNYMLGL